MIVFCLYSCKRFDAAIKIFGDLVKDDGLIIFIERMSVPFFKENGRMIDFWLGPFFTWITLRIPRNRHARDKRYQWNETLIHTFWDSLTTNSIFFYYYLWAFLFTWNIAIDFIDNDWIVCWKILVDCCVLFNARLIGLSDLHDIRWNLFDNVHLLCGCILIDCIRFDLNRCCFCLYNGVLYIWLWFYRWFANDCLKFHWFVCYQLIISQFWNDLRWQKGLLQQILTQLIKVHITEIWEKKIVCYTMTQLKNMISFVPIVIRMSWFSKFHPAKIPTEIQTFWMC